MHINLGRKIMPDSDRASALMLLAVEIDDSSYISIVREGHRYRPVLRIRRTDPENLRVLHQHFGGTFAQSSNGYWYWSVTHRRATELMREVYPEVHVKREHLDSIFQLEESKKRTKRSRGARLTESEKAFRQELIDRIKELNKSQTSHEQAPA